MHTEAGFYVAVHRGERLVGWVGFPLQCQAEEYLQAITCAKDGRDGTWLGWFSADDAKAHFVGKRETWLTVPAASGPIAGIPAGLEVC